MRLRSSHFVFLVLLLCSVQLRDGLALQVVEGAISDRSGSASQRHEASAIRARHLGPADLAGSRVDPGTTLEAASLKAHRAPWPMRQPDREAAAISSYTGFIRA
jgi:hypothetical protein